MFIYMYVKIGIAKKDEVRRNRSVPLNLKTKNVSDINVVTCQIRGISTGFW